jgi:hypothetical protein
MREDYLPIVRAMMKMSSALNDYDDLEQTKYHKFKLKRSLKEWASSFDILSSKMIKTFVDESEGAFHDAYEQFNHFKGDLKIKNNEITCLIILYCKLKSSVNDLEEVPFHVGAYLKVLLEQSANRVLTDIEKQYAEILKIKDSDGQGIDAIIKDYDDLGKTMFINIPQNEESE